MKVISIGDVFLGDQLARFGFGVCSLAAGGGYARCFANSEEILGSAEVVFGNLESALGLPPPADQHFRTLLNRGHRRGAQALRDAGIDVVSLANNHSFEHGVDGLALTIELLEEAGVDHVGSTTQPFHVRHHGGLDVAFLGWSMIPDNYWPDLRASDYYHVTDDVEEILDEVVRVRSDVDRIVLALHWGYEYVDVPSRSQRDAAHRLVEAGVDVLAGHHPHVVQPIEDHPDGVIAYSLGNFVFDVWSGEDRHGLALRTDLTSGTWSADILEIDPSMFGPSSDVDPQERRRLERVVVNELRLSAAAAAEAAHDARSRYRWKTLWYALRNMHRFARKREVVGLAVRRAWFLLRNLRSERSDPYVVYRGPMK